MGQKSGVWRQIPLTTSGLGKYRPTDRKPLAPWIPLWQKLRGGALTQISLRASFPEKSDPTFYRLTDQLGEGQRWTRLPSETRLRELNRNRRLIRFVKLVCFTELWYKTTTPKPVQSIQYQPGLRPRAFIHVLSHIHVHWHRHTTHLYTHTETIRSVRIFWYFIFKNETNYKFIYPLNEYLYILFKAKIELPVRVPPEKIVRVGRLKKSITLIKRSHLDRVRTLNCFQARSSALYQISGNMKNMNGKPPKKEIGLLINI